MEVTGDSISIAENGELFTIHCRGAQTQGDRRLRRDGFEQHRGLRRERRTTASISDDERSDHGRRRSHRHEQGRACLGRFDGALPHPVITPGIDDRDRVILAHHTCRHGLFGKDHAANSLSAETIGHLGSRCAITQRKGQERRISTSQLTDAGDQPGKHLSRLRSAQQHGHDVSADFKPLLSLRRLLVELRVCMASPAAVAKATMSCSSASLNSPPPRFSVR